MTKGTHKARGWFKWVDLSLWLVGLGAISFCAYHYKDIYSVTIPWVKTKKDSFPPAVLNLQELLYIAAPLFTFLFTVTAHFADKWLHGGGIAQRAGEIKHLHNLQTDVVTGTMTKQSVLVALASLFILFVQQDRGLSESDYHIVVRWLASAGFLISVFLMLISVKTYDYANRFNWEEHSEHPQGSQSHCFYRIQLAGKAFRLDIIAFYFLFFTAILATGLIEPWFPILASLLCGVLLWTSYFFLRKKEVTLPSMEPHSVTLSVADPAVVAEWYKKKLGFADGKQSGLLEKNGFVIQFTNVEGTSTNGVTQLSFRVDDVNETAREMKKGGDVEILSDVAEDRSAGIKQFVIKDKSGIPLRFVQKLK